MANEIPDSFDPSFCISAKVMRINRLTAQIFRNHLSAFDVSNSQVSLLFVLTKRPNLRQRDLSDFLILEKSSLNRNLKRLFERGLIEKSANLIHLTDAGLAFVAEIIPAWENAMVEIRSKIGESGEEAIHNLVNNLKPE